MRRLLKWNLPPVGEQRVALHVGTCILAIGWQGKQLVAWTESPSEGDLEWFVFTVAMTGDPVPNGEYVATAQLDEGAGPYVVHVYRRGEGPV
jgi:hypothetical protein